MADSDVVPLMGIVDAATIDRLRQIALRLDSVPVPPVLIPPLERPMIGSFAHGLPPASTARRGPLFLVRLSVEREHLGDVAGQHLGYDAPLDPASPAVPGPEETNTSWMVPLPTGDVTRVRTVLGVDDAACTPTAGALPAVPLVAVLDSGIDHPSLAVRDRWPSAASDPGFATGVHGNMVAFDVRIAAPFAELRDVGVLRPRQGRRPALSDAAEGLQWAAAESPPPDIVCCSWMVLHEPTLPGVLSYTYDRNHPFTLLVRVLVNGGLCMVFAAGNCGLDGYDPGCGSPSDVGPGRSIRGANGELDVISVGATDVRGRWLSNSSPGPSTLGFDKPDVCGLAAFAGYHRTGDHGTSAACGVVAGVVALLKRNFPGASPAALRRVLRDTAVPRPSQGIASGFDPYWGAGTVNAAAACHRLANPVAGAAGVGSTPLLDLADGVIGRAPLSCLRKIQALCENREDVFGRLALSEQERRAIETMDGPLVARLLRDQMQVALAHAFAGRAVLPPAIPPDDSAASCGEERPRLLLNLVADVARDDAAREAFLDDRRRFVRSRYALSPTACRLAEQVTASALDELCQEAESEVLRVSSNLEIEPMYPNVQSFPGPWIDSFVPDRAHLDEAVAVTIEGRGFAVGKPVVIGLVERRIGSSPGLVCPREASLSQTVPAPLAAQRGRLLDDACELALAVEAPASCSRLPGDIEIASEVCGTTIPELVPPRLRLGTVQLAERFDPDSAAPRFRIEVVFDLHDVRVVPGEYDLWVGYCDAAGCRARAAVGPTTFTVLEPR